MEKFLYFLHRAFLCSLFLLSVSSQGLVVSAPRSHHVDTASVCKIWRQRPQMAIGMMCTGTLIQDLTPGGSSRWVLTAAHCGAHPKDSEASFFVSCEGDFHQARVPVRQVHRHPDFEFDGRSHDMALFELVHEMPRTRGALVPAPYELEEVIARAQDHHHFEVKLVDYGVTGSFGRSRFMKEYRLVNEESPMVECAVIGMGKDETGMYGHLQSQGLSLVYFLDLNLNHLLFPYNKTSHGLLFQSGDSGGPLLCQRKGRLETLVLGVNSHSMEEVRFSFSTPSHLYWEWIRDVQRMGR